MSHECIPLIEGDTSCLCGKEILMDTDESWRDDLPAWEDPTPSMPFPVFTTMFNRMGGF